MIDALVGIALALGQISAGMPLPELKGDYLTKEDARLPEDAAGKVALLALGFTYESRHPVEEWSKRFRERFADAENVTFYEVPMMGGMAKLARPFIDMGMRKGTPERYHRNVITVYGGVKPWKKLVSYEGGDDAYLLLLDSEGNIAWTYRGPFDSAAFAELTSTTEGLLNQTGS